jgi:hypothetical protein
LPWTLGVFFTLCFSTYVYFRAFLASRRSKSLMSLFSIWSVGAVALLAAVPLVWGDARFRIALWPIVLVWWGWSLRENKHAANF